MKKVIIMIGLIIFVLSCTKDDNTPNIVPPAVENPEDENEVDVEPSIEISNVSVVSTDEDHVKIQVEPMVSNAKNISYSLLLKNHPDEFIPVDFVQSSGGDSLFIEETEGAMDKELLENGNRDEDNKSGSFAYTFLTDYWAGGSYDLEIIAVAKSNDENTGSIITAKKEFQIEIYEDLSETEKWIKTYNFRSRQVGVGKVKVMFQARSNNVPIGSFNIKLQEHPDGGKPDIFVDYSSALYILEDGTANIPDNGELDEDPRVNHFAYTFNMNDWADGDFKFDFIASVRPNDGPWVGAEIKNIVFNKDMFR